MSNVHRTRFAKFTLFAAMPPGIHGLRLACVFICSCVVLYLCVCMRAFEYVLICLSCVHVCV